MEDVNELKWNITNPSSNDGETFYLYCDNGYFLLLQIMYSTMNSWQHSIQISCRIHGPDSYKKAVTWSKYAADFSLSADKLSVKCDPFKITRIKDLDYNVKVKSNDIDLDINLESISGGFRTKEKHLFELECYSMEDSNLRNVY